MRTPAARLLVRLVALSLALGSLGVGAQPYLRTQMQSSNLCIYWQTRAYLWQLDQAGYSQLDFQSLDTTVQAAFQTWQSLSNSCSSYQFSEGAPVANPTIGYNIDGGANYNVIMFREQNCTATVSPSDPCWNAGTCGNQYNCWSHSDQTIALTTATYDTRSGVIMDADIELNAAPHTAENAPAYLFTVVSSPPCGATQSPACVATDLQNTLTHEIGHVIGLAHVPGPTSTMFASAQIGETSKRIIDYGTSQGFCGIYPAGQASTASCDLSNANQSISASAQGTGCSAVPGRSTAGTFAALLLLCGAWMLRRRGAA